MTLPSLQPEGEKGAIHAFARILCALGDATPTPQVLAAARTKTLHAIGVALAGRSLAAVEVAARAVGREAGPCTAIGLKGGLSGGAASFFNGVAAHASLLEDCGPGGLREGSHPGTYVFPAALAAAQLAGADAGRFLRGMIVGYEAVSRLGLAAPASIVGRRFRPLGISGPFGAAAAAAYIFGADADGMATTLAIAANSAGGTTQGVFEGAMEAFFQAGSAARNGLFAAELGLAGAVSAQFALEGDFGFFQTYGGEQGNLSELLAEREEPGICRVGIKRFASCLQNQQTMALIVDSLPAPLSAQSIERVSIRRPAVGTNGLNSPGVSRAGAVPNRLGAQMSARFTAASAMLGRRVDDPKFYQDHYADAEILALTDRIALDPAEEDGIRIDIAFSGGQPPIRLEGTSPELFYPSFETVRDRILQRAASDQAEALGQVARIVASMEDGVSLSPLEQTLGLLA